MALVPIIYTSLLIFSSLLLFVIIVSYISYKAKDKNPPYIKSNVTEQYSEFKPANLNFNNLPAKPASIQYSQSINYPVINPEEDQERGNFNKPIQNISRNDKTYASHSQPIRRNVKVEAYNKFQEVKGMNQKPTFSRSRIKIMNDSGQFGTTPVETEFDNSHNSVSSENNLSEINLFNYYSDRQDLGLVMLSARHR